MYILLDKINKQNIIIGNKTKNNIMYNSNYYNILYSDELCTLNSIIFLLHIKHYKYKQENNKYLLYFNENLNQELLDKIKNVEINILNCFQSNKIQKYNLFESLTKNYIKINNEYHPKNNKNLNNINNNILNNNIFLKISGIWENDINYGLIYKFFINHPL
jgi:hypothetical protein